MAKKVVRFNMARHSPARLALNRLNVDAQRLQLLPHLLAIKIPEEVIGIHPKALGFIFCR